MKKYIKGFAIAVLAIMTVACGNNTNNEGFSSDDSRLKELVQEINSSLPLFVGNDISIDKIEYDNHEITISYVVEDGLMDFDGIRANDRAFRENMLLSYANNSDENFKKIIDEIIDADASMKLVFKTKSGSDSHALLFTAEDLKANRPSEGADPEKLLKSVVDNTRLQTPQDIGDGLVLTDALLDEHYFTYVCSCDESEVDIDALRENGSLLKQSILEELQSADGIFQQTLVSLKKTNRGVTYKYVGSTSGKPFTVRIKPGEF